LTIAIPKPDPNRNTRLAEKYGEAWREATAHRAPETTISPQPTREPSAGIEAAPALASPVPLAEKRIGPGPLGDEADVLALLPCPGCAVELLAKWLPPAPKPQPLIRFERRWFLEGGLGVAETGYAALIGGGYDFARISRVTVGVRGTAILADDPAGFVGLTFRWESR
jgi:hypothetical protein